MKTVIRLSVALLAAAIAVAPAAAQPLDAAVHIDDAQVRQDGQVHLSARVTGASLEAGQLEVLVDGSPRDFVSSNELDGAHAVAILVDVSGSMGGAPLTAAKQTVSEFVESLPETVDIAVLSYASAVEIVSPFGASRQEHVDGIDRLVAAGRTAMLDAIELSSQMLTEQTADHRTLVVLTDGEDNASTVTVDEAIDAVTASGIRVHGVAYRTAFSEQEALRRVTEAGRGSLLQAEDAAGLADVYAGLLRDLTNHVTITFDTAGTGSRVVTVRFVGDTTVESSTTIVVPDAEPAAAPSPPADESAVIVPPAAIEAGVRTDANFSVFLIVGAGLWFASLAILFTTLAMTGQSSGKPIRRSGSRLRTRTRTELAALAERASSITEAQLRRHGRDRSLQSALERAGIGLRAGEFVAITVAITAASAWFAAMTLGPVTAIGAAVLTLVGARMVVSTRRQKRQARFVEQLPDTLQTLAGSLRVGHSFLQSADAVAQESQQPTADEFHRLVVEARLGRDVVDSLKGIQDRIQSEDFGWIVQAIEIQQEVGGNLAEIFETVAETVRERAALRRQVRALSAEGRLSAYVLIGLPFAFVGFLTLANPTYLGEFVNSGSLGYSLIAVACTLTLLGIVWMRRIIQIRP